MSRKQPGKSAKTRKAPRRRPTKADAGEALPSEAAIAPATVTSRADVAEQPPEPIFDEPDAPARRPLREAIATRDGHSDTLLFRVGAERFAIDLAGVEEAIELPAVHHLPEMPEHLLGVFELRGRLVPIYSPERVLGVRLAAREAAAVLVLRAGEKRLGLAVDDVDDVLTIEGRSVRRAPIPDNEDSVLLGVIRRGAELLALVDGESLALACLADSLTEAT